MLKICDLFCGGGGCSMGYYQACQALGIEVEIHGIDIAKHSNYPFIFHQADAMSFPLL